MSFARCRKAIRGVTTCAQWGLGTPRAQRMLWAGHGRVAAFCSGPSPPQAHPKPTLEIARAMPQHIWEMPNDIVIAQASAGDPLAIQERLIRGIMAHDKCTWQEAYDITLKMAQDNDSVLGIAHLPYKILIGSAVAAAFVSFPLVFDLQTAHMFNDYMVTTDVPKPADLETCLEVGAWTWGWMEPVMGQLSFFLLCLQFGRNQMQNLGIRPFTDQLEQMRAARLVGQYPQYDRKLVMAFSDQMHGLTKTIVMTLPEPAKRAKAPQ